MPVAVVVCIASLNPLARHDSVQIASSVARRGSLLIRMRSSGESARRDVQRARSRR